MRIEATAQSFAIYAPVVARERSRATACTEAMRPCEYAPPLEKPPVKPLSILEQGGGEGQSPTRRVSRTLDTGWPSAAYAHPPDETPDESSIEGSPVGPPDHEGSPDGPLNGTPVESP